ncbi:MAG TPA: dioxygenase [Hyphomicrobiaceae bacterium]|nr:dioxygenase [Hyphomicrobiaceae bacterium]
MIIENEASVTTAVIEAFSRTENSRSREILLCLVRHLHGFVREVRLTEAEFHEAVRLIAALGQHTTAWHNEAMLMSGSLGVSALVCLLNNGNGGQTETQANLLGPFWRDDQPLCRSGDSLVRSPTAGPGLICRVEVVDGNNRPLAGAEVDVWQSSPEGLYENQDATQAELNLRGRFLTDEEGRFCFRSVKPAGYPVPIDGPVGELMAATGRHNFRPAHLHFMLYKPGFKTLISQIYCPDDPYLASDAQFGVTRALIGNFQRHDAAEDAVGLPAPWYSLNQRFRLEPGEASRPRAPIGGKAPQAAPSAQGRGAGPSA